MRARTRLVQARNRRPVRGPSLDRSKVSALVRRGGAAMAGPAPVRRVPTLEIDGSVDMPPQNNALGKVGRQRCESLEESLRYVSFDVVPTLRAIRQLVGKEADDLEDVLPHRCPGRINDRRRDGEKDGIVQVELTGPERCEHAMQRRN